jgi:hypothetical protein
MTLHLNFMMGCRPSFAALIFGLCLSLNAAPNDLPSSNVTRVTPSNQTSAPASDDAYARVLGLAAKEYEQAYTNPPPRKVHLPNFNSGPGLSQPIGWNFYETELRFPDYLLCDYDVSENAYDKTNEGEWFKASLLQIRALGQHKFPPVKWFAVIIVNRAEHKGEGTFEQSHKVGAVFKASDIFDFSNDLSQLIADAATDRHPFKYDTNQPTSGEQQRWLIVERHAATNAPTTGPKK